MYLHPNDYLWMADQDRERAMAQRALERAARTGGEVHSSTLRGGISSIVGILRRAAASTTNLGPGDSSPTAPMSGASAR